MLRARRNCSGRARAWRTPKDAEQTHSQHVSHAKPANHVRHASPQTPGHSALLPVFLQTRYRPAGAYPSAPCALAIHNLAHQGLFPSHAFNGLSLPGGAYGSVGALPV